MKPGPKSVSRFCYVCGALCPGSRAAVKHCVGKELRIYKPKPLSLDDASILWEIDFPWAFPLPHGLEELLASIDEFMDRHKIEAIQYNDAVTLKLERRGEG